VDGWSRGEGWTSLVSPEGANGCRAGIDGGTGTGSRANSARRDERIPSYGTRAHRFKGLPACPLFKCMLNARGGVHDSLINPLARRIAPRGYFTAVRRNRASSSQSPDQQLCFTPTTLLRPFPCWWPNAEICPDNSTSLGQK